MVFYICRKLAGIKSVSKGVNALSDSGQKARMIESVIKQYREKGIKFTMDDVANDLHMSKKTIYKYYKDKDSMLIDAVNEFFDTVKKAEDIILKDDELDYYEKLRRVLSAMPNQYDGMEFGQLYMTKEKHPKVYECIARRLESGWEPTIRLLEEGIASGKLRNFSIPIMKTMMETTLEQFFQKDVLVKNDIPYNTALNEVVDILINGIRNN